MQMPYQHKMEANQIKYSKHIDNETKETFPVHFTRQFHGDIELSRSNQISQNGASSLKSQIPGLNQSLLYPKIDATQLNFFSRVPGGIANDNRQQIPSLNINPMLLTPQLKPNLSIGQSSNGAIPQSNISGNISFLGQMVPSMDKTQVFPITPLAANFQNISPVQNKGFKSIFNQSAAEKQLPSFMPHSVLQVNTQQIPNLQMNFASLTNPLNRETEDSNLKMERNSSQLSFQSLAPQSKQVHNLQGLSKNLSVQFTHHKD